MTNSEVLQKFDAAVDISQLQQDFPDIEWVITQLDDGQQEIIVRVQGADADFHPFSDYAAIENLTVNDIPDGDVKNGIVLDKLKRHRRRQREQRLYKALLKRVGVLLVSAGVEPSEFVRVIKNDSPVEEVQL